MRPRQTFLIALTLFALSCQKQKNNPTPPTPPATQSIQATFNFHLSYPDSSRTPAANWELIVTEPGGKQLLDTLVPVNTPVTATIHTADSLINLTSVYQGPSDTAALVSMLTGVNPTTLATPVVNYATSPRLLGPSIIRPIRYLNIPTYNVLTDRIYWSQDISAAATDINSMGNPPRRVGNYFLINWASKGLYHFYPWRDGSLTDTFDLALLTDNSVQLNLTAYPGYRRPLCFVLGIMDTTDYTKSLFLYNYVYNIFQNITADAVYPTKNVQKFELLGTYIGNDSTEVTVYSYGNTITADHPFINATNFSLLSRQQDSFAVKFNNVQLTWYETRWKTTDSKVNFYIYSSPDSTIRHPLTLLNSLKSQKLQGQSLSALTPVMMLMFAVPGVKYADYMTYGCSPAQWKAKRFPGATELQRNF